LKAVRIHAHGGIDRLCYGETDDPEIQSATDVIVKLKFAAINRIDLAIRAGVSGAKISTPRILGTDGAGTVAAVGAEVKAVRTGDAVCLYPMRGCGRCPACLTEQASSCAGRCFFGERDDGTYAEYIRVPETNCFAIPLGLSFEEAAAFPLVYVTAWRMLITHADVKPGDWVLVLGTGGGVATASLHLAIALGARVIVVSSSDAKLARALELGATHGLNYRSQDFANEARRLTEKHGVDVVVDCSGGQNWTRCFAAIARGGRLVTCSAGAGASPKNDLKRVFWNHLKIYGTMAGNRAEFYRLVAFMAVSRRKPVIDQVFPLEDAKWAQQRMQEGRQFGKIILRVDP